MRVNVWNAIIVFPVRQDSERSLKCTRAAGRESRSEVHYIAAKSVLHVKFTKKQPLAVARVYKRRVDLGSISVEQKLIIECDPTILFRGSRKRWIIRTRVDLMFEVDACRPLFANAENNGQARGNPI